MLVWCQSRQKKFQQRTRNTPQPLRQQLITLQKHQTRLDLQARHGNPPSRAVQTTHIQPFPYAQPHVQYSEQCTEECPRRKEKDAMGIKMVSFLDKCFAHSTKTKYGRGGEHTSGALPEGPALIRAQAKHDWLTRPERLPSPILAHSQSASKDAETPFTAVPGLWLRQ